MIIDTDITVKDADGNQGHIAVKSPGELLAVMEREGVTECRITVSSLGTEFIKSNGMTLSDVRKWAEME